MSRDHRSAPWAVHRDLLPDLGAYLAGRADPAQLQARLARAQAAEGEDRQPAGGQVAIIPLHGLVTPRASLLSLLFGGGAGGLEGFAAQVRAAVADPDVDRIVLDIDSPGGLVDLVPETAGLIRDLRGEKPITAVANTWAASAAYWIASAADEIVVTPSGEVGSIGVYLMHTDVSKALDDEGVAVTLISAGKHKTEGNPYEPLSREAKAEMQGYVDDLYGMFVDGVAAGRDVSTKTVERDFGQGRMIRPDAAVAAGMADRVDTLENTLRGLGAEPAADPAPDVPDDAVDDDDAEARAETSPPSGGGDEGQQIGVAELLLP